MNGGRKALLIGINYVGSSNALNGCHQDVRNMKNFLLSQGWFEGDMVVLTDEQHVNPHSPAYPSGQNILRAMQWLVDRSDNHSLFLHYSGHGGQVRDHSGEGIDDTICPVDFQNNGQIDSEILHQQIVSPMPESAQLTAIFDCCHSGSVMELPYTYRTDEDGNVNIVDNLKQGLRLATGAATLLQGGFTMEKVRDAQQLYAGARSFFQSMKHMGEEHQEGLDSSGRPHDYSYEAKRVFLYSGCRDDQTSADASISGASVGAMSWAFLEVMKQNWGHLSYVDILRHTRGNLQQSYSQVPQLSCGQQIDLNQPFRI